MRVVLAEQRSRRRLLALFATGTGRCVWIAFCTRRAALRDPHAVCGVEALRQPFGNMRRRVGLGDACQIGRGRHVLVRVASNRKARTSRAIARRRVGATVMRLRNGARCFIGRCVRGRGGDRRRVLGVERRATLVACASAGIGDGFTVRARTQVQRRPAFVAEVGARRVGVTAETAGRRWHRERRLRTKRPRIGGSGGGQVPASGLHHPQVMPAIERLRTTSPRTNRSWLASIASRSYR